MLPPNKIKTTIYALLTRREYSSAMIEQKLITKGFELADIQAALADLCTQGIVNDTRFAESYIRYKQTRGYGPMRIHQELLTHGISKEKIEDHLDITDNAWLAEVKRVWQKRFRGIHPTDLKERGKQFRFLLYRGFTKEQIETIFDLT